MKNKYFKEALVSMCSKAAYVDSIRHMYDKGMDYDEIRKNCSYPVSVEKIKSVIAEYEEEKNSPSAEYEYIQETGEYGKKSFIRRKKC